MSTNTSTGSVDCTPTWKIEFDNRIRAFAKSIGLSEETVRLELEKNGISGKTEQSLTDIDQESILPMSDLFEIFVDTDLVKKARLRAGIPHLRGKTHLGETSDSLNGNIADALREIAEVNRPISSLGDVELLKRYEEGATEVIKVLRERSHGRPCIVRNKDESVNEKVSLELLRLARKQPTANTYQVDGKLVRVYRVGEFPAKPLDESPFYAGVALVNGFCPQSKTDWSEICQEIRVLVRLQTLIDTSSKSEMRQIWKNAKSMSVEQFRGEYAEAALRYDELEEKDELPKLRVYPNSPQKVDTGF